MANYTALYEAAHGVVELLRREITPEPISKPERIGLCPPYDPGDLQLTVWLYQLEEDKTRVNHRFVPEGKEGERLAPLPLRLSLLITAHSKAQAPLRAADECRILGRAVQAVRDCPLLTPQQLSGSLAQGEQPLRLTLLSAPADQLLKLWSHAEKPYKLSFACEVAAVQLDSHRVRPVRRVTEVVVGLEERHDP